MAQVLGLSFFYHDSAAALVRDGRIVAAAAEERFCRRKHTDEFPKRAIEYCLEAAELESIDQLDAIVFYEKPVLKLFRVVESLARAWPMGLASFTRRLPHFLSTKLNVQRLIERTLPAYTGPVFFARHHLSHAGSAFYCSPFDRAAILTLDAVGEWETTTIGVGNGDRVELKRAIHFPHSIGMLYSALTGYLGFEVNDGEWKVMGLAAYGRPTYAETFRRLVQQGPDGSFRLNMAFFRHRYSSRWIAHNRRWERFFGFPPRRPEADLTRQHMDLACSGQLVVEELILNLAREARRVGGCDNLVIAGGVGLNGVANWRIEREGVFDNVWIQPAAGDDGGAVGAALLIANQVFGDERCPPMTHAYWGPAWPDPEIVDFLRLRGIPFEQLDEEQLVERTAELIADGRVVGWMQGRMEYGPRALGARSLLADATNPRMKAVINEKVKFREFFRPFAPAVMQERVHEFFEVPQGADLSFMVKVPRVREDQRSLIPAVTHEDGTARVQTVHREQNALFHRLLRAVERRTGVPIVLNTSFNVRGEPIVCSPEDAYNCFVNSGIDAVVIGPCLVTQKPAPTAGTERAPVIQVQRYEDRHDPNRHSTTVTENVLAFYKELPFNYYSNAVDAARQLLRSNQIRTYPPLHRYLTAATEPSILDVGCGVGWFANSCARFYQANVVALDINPVVLKQARSVARLLPCKRSTEFVECDVFDYEPRQSFDVVNSLGVLHSTRDCHAAIRRVVKWIAPGGYLHLGLYHLYGRRPFLEHFQRMERAGASEADLYEEFRILCDDISDEVHLRSWFRDQVIHPFETQHTYEEIQGLLADEGFRVIATSINRFRPLPPPEKLIQIERALEVTSRRAIERERRYFPGFFLVWARRAS
jgi:carbamoyltransferase